MKKLLPVALLLCAVFTFSGFVSAEKQPVPVETVKSVSGKVAVPLTWPITGTYGPYSYSLSSPYIITFYTTSTGALIGSYSLTYQTGSSSVYQGTTPGVSGLTGVSLAIYSNGTQYNLDFFGIY